MAEEARRSRQATRPKLTGQCRQLGLSGTECVETFEIGEGFRGWSIKDNPTIGEAEHALNEREQEIAVTLSENDCKRANGISCQRSERLEKFALSAWIQLGGWLVEHEQFGLGCERNSQGETLLLPAGKVPGRPIRFVR